MFFSPELLARRDSGFGLIWLAATLGSKSTFKKLPKRSVLTADIARLCDLIAEPAEPLALRLSSNLMVGVARVYKVKQEIFMNDVTNCVTSLKKMVQELKSTAALDAQLQMAQPSVRRSALTLAADPRSAFLMDFDALVANWDEYLNIVETKGYADSDSDEFNPNARKGKKKAKALGPHLPHAEAVRAEQHTLTEHHEHLLSASFDLSYNDNGGVVDPSSSQAEAVFDFENNFFTPSDGLDIGALADELERELGWGVSPARNINIPMEVDNSPGHLSFDLGFNLEGDGDLVFNEPMDLVDNGMHPPPPTFNTPQRLKRKTPEVSGKEIYCPTPSLQSKKISTLHQPSPATSFSRLLLSQDEQSLPLTNITANINNQANQGNGNKKAKRTRLLLDARTELTDDELKTARTQYLQSQGILRRQIDLKQSEKEKGKMVEEMVWGVPSCIQAPILVDFWQENFKVQVEARSGALYIHPREEPPKKRRKTSDAVQTRADDVLGDEVNIYDPNFDVGIDVDMGAGMDMGDGALGSGHQDDELPNRHLRSSEEPGQGRHASRPPSLLQDFGFDVAQTGSQKSSLFPWDNAGGSSSTGAFGMPGSDHIHIDHADVRIRGSSLGRRDSSLIPSQLESLVGGPGFSPAPIRKGSQTLGDDYVFEVDQVGNSAANDSQRSNDANLVSLEKNSFNFFEYAKMQLHSLPLYTPDLDFDIIAPRETSTRHVAATAFYHCLVLATKDLLRLKQPEAYGRLSIAII